MKQLYAYTDESGNTGSNLFDKEQPVFWTGTIISEFNLDITGENTIKKSLEILGTHRIHAKEIGLVGIEKISNLILECFKKNNCSFVFTQIEKRYFASLKFADLILDNGINKAVSAAHYGIRLLRMMLVYSFIKQVSPISQEEFWIAYGSGNIEKFKKVLERVKINIVNKINDQREKNY